MTGSQLLARALALLATSGAEAPEYADAALPLVNLLLAETFGADNALRAAAGAAEAAAPQSIGALSEALPCDERLAAAALPYGLAARLLLGDDDAARAAVFHNLYVAAVADCQTGVRGDCDLYAGGAL